MKIKKIYFDLDGVLADFDRGVKELCGMESANQSDMTPADNDRLFAAIKSVDNFYNRLELIPGASRMFHAIDAMYPEDCEILTGIPKPRRGIEGAAEDKTEWVHKNIGKNIKVNIAYREEKKNYARGPLDVLVDDYERNIEEWEKAGGTGILFTSAEETLKRIREIECSFGGNRLLSTPYCGWSEFNPGDKQYGLGYLTDIPVEWLDAAIHGLETMTPFSVHGFCEPWRMICTVDYWNCHVIFCNDSNVELTGEYVKYETIHINMMEFCKMLQNDISNDIDEWASWTLDHYDGNDVFLEKKEKIQEKLIRLQKLITEKEKMFEGKYCFF